MTLTKKPRHFQFTVVGSSRNLSKLDVSRPWLTTSHWLIYAKKKSKLFFPRLGNLGHLWDTFEYQNVLGCPKFPSLYFFIRIKMLVSGDLRLVT